MSLEKPPPAAAGLSHKVNKSAFSMSAGTFFSRILGFARDMIIGWFFTRTQTDAFFVAFRFPNFFRRFFGEGALTVSFVPVFIECLHGEGEEKTYTRGAEQKKDSSLERKNLIQAKNLMNSIYTLILVVVSSLTVLGVFFMEEIIFWMFDSYPFSAVEGKMEMTTRLAQFLFIYLFLVVNYAYFTAVANALNYFFIPALAPAVFNTAVILSVFFIPQDLFVYPAMVLAVGVLAGGVLQALMTAVVLYRRGFLPCPKLTISKRFVVMVLWRFLPGVVGIGGFALLGFLNVFFAGWLTEGAHTFIYYADRLLELPRSLIAVSMGTALLPTLSKLISLKKTSAMLELAAEQRDLLFFIVLPCSLGLYFLGAPIIEVLFARGKFDLEAAKKTAQVLSIYSVLLFVLCLSQLLGACFFAVKNTWYPALCTLTSIAVHILLAPVLISLFDLRGLVWATTGSSFVQLVCLCAGYRYFVGSFYFRRTGVRLIKILPLLAVFGFYIYYGFYFFLFLFSYLGSFSLAKALALFTVIASSIFLYGYASLKLNYQQAKAVNLFFKKQNRSP